MTTRYIDARPPHTRSAARQAAASLGAGRIVAIPTDTVYGLAVRADDSQAVRSLFAAKRRPDTNPLPLLLPDTAAIARVCAEVPPLAKILAEAFWPGPLTIVVPRSETVSDEVTGGKDTVGVRVPDDPIALAVLRECDFLVAVTSANLSALSPAREPEQVRRDFAGTIELILAGGRCRGGVPSTVVDVTTGTARVLRAGDVSMAQIRQALGEA